MEKMENIETKAEYEEKENKEIKVENKEDGVTRVRYKDKEYVFKVITFRKFKQAFKAVTKPDGNVDTMDLLTKLISMSLVEPKMNDMELEELPASEALFLSKIVGQIYEIPTGDNFLGTSNRTQ